MEADVTDLSRLESSSYDLVYTGGHVGDWVSDLRAYYREAIRILRKRVCASSTSTIRSEGYGRIPMLRWNFSAATLTMDRTNTVLMRIDSQKHPGT